MGGPNFNHQAAMEYGFATPNGRFSDYITYNGQRFVPYYGYSSTNVAAYNCYFCNSYQSNDQFTNNFVYKFGKNNNQSLQILYTNISQQAWGNAGGIPQGSYPSNPNALVYYPFDTLGNALWMELGGGYRDEAKPSSTGLVHRPPALHAGLQPADQRAPAGAMTPQTRLLKIEYDDRLGTNAYLALRYYNWEQLQSVDNQSSLNAGDRAARRATRCGSRCKVDRRAA